MTLFASGTWSKRGANGICDNCGEVIAVRADYWAERIGGGVPTIRLRMGKLCQRCYQVTTR
jgi:hypothetical protein